MKTPRLLPLLPLLAAACAHAPPRAPVVWPDPPETPRIRFVRSIASEGDVDDGAWASFRRFLTGDLPARLGRPTGIAVSDDGKRVYVADFGRAGVYRIDLEHKTFSPFTVEEPMRSAFNVALDGEENAYVSDPVGRRVVVFDRNGAKLRSFGSEAERPTGLALDRARAILYVADGSYQKSSNHRVLAYSLEGKLLRQVGRGRGSGDGEFNFPTYLAVDGRGRLHVADTLNFRIQVFDADGRFERAYGTAGDQPGTFTRLKGLAFDAFGNLYAVDGEYAVVQIFNRSFELLLHFAGKAPRLEYLQLPGAIAIDQKDNFIYVGEQDNGRLNVYQLVNTSAADSLPPAPPFPGAKTGR
jgi:DNA-binding beta-propeller fold protein YncE